MINWQGYMIVAIPLLAGWLLDRIMGDPAWLPHPVVLYGKIISFFEHQLNQGIGRKMKGGIMSFLLVLSVFIIVWLILVVSIFGIEDCSDSHWCVLLSRGNNVVAGS